MIKNLFSRLSHINLYFLCSQVKDVRQELAGSDAFYWNAPETHRKMEAVFQPELSRNFSDDFRPFLTGKHRELTGIHRKKNSGRNTASTSGAFLWDTVAGIFVLGCISVQSMTQLYLFLFCVNTSKMRNCSFFLN